MKPINPFPALPVASLRPDGEVEQLTVHTPGIEKAEELTMRYLQQVEKGGRQGLNVAVQGEYGSGKTHLLSYVDYLLRSSSPSAGVLSLVAIEASPVEWYSAVIGPQLASLDLADLATNLYGKAARTVALQAPLTAPAAAQLEEDPGKAHILVQNDLLSSTSVDNELISILNLLAPDLALSVRDAVERLPRDPRPAIRWLEGGTLSTREVAATGLTPAITSDSEAADAVIAIAAIHRYLELPFAVLLDELEHLVRYDAQRGGKSNLTWFKRLLERLERGGTLTFVAGHQSTWEGHPDFLQRISPTANISLAPLDALAVVEIVRRHEGNIGSLTRENADLIANCSRGNIRRAISQLRQLHEVTEGFQTPLHQSQIQDAANSIESRSDPEEALDSLMSILEGLGLQVSRRGTIGDLLFDLIAYDGEDPRVVAEVKQSRFGVQQQEQAQRFIDKLRIASHEAPACIGLFLSAGEIDAALLEIDTSDAKLFWLDLTRSNFPGEVQQILEAMIGSPASSRTPSSDPKRQDDELAEIADQIQERKQVQASEYDQLSRRLDEPDSPGNLSFRAPPIADTHDLRRVMFEEFTRRPNWIGQLSLMRSRRLVLAAVLLILGIGLISLAPAFADSLSETEDLYVFDRALFYLLGAFSVVGSMVFAGNEFLVLEKFFKFREERLRDVYVLDLPVKALVDTNRILEQAENNSGPGRYGTEEALYLLDRAGLARDFRAGDLEQQRAGDSE